MSSIANIVLILVILLLVGLAGHHVYRSKKRGETCIGCPCSGQCSGHCSSENRGDASRRS